MDQLFQSGSTGDNRLKQSLFGVGAAKQSSAQRMTVQASASGHFDQAPIGKLKQYAYVPGLKNKEKSEGIKIKFN